MPQRLGPKLLNFASEIDVNTVEQANLAASMPFVHPHVSLMPDAHLGKGSAVGTVIPTKGAVIPAAVGVDIGCGMVAAKTRFTERDLAARFGGEYAQELPTLRRLVEDAIPPSPGNYNKKLQRFPFTAKKHDELLELQADLDVDLSHSPKWMQQLGSLGGGNHFIELCVDNNDNVWLFLHSGSRGVGNKIAQRHINIALQQCSGDPLIKVPNRDLAFLNEGTPEFDRYIRDLKWAQRFAYLNRAEMMDRFIHVFASWLGVQPQRVETERINCHHNYTAPTRLDGETCG
ncbi:RNA-splicing ligase RtcB [Mycobacterium pseudokansasii]|uniref:3'-phosphate/5'-hydroxy nucleic acid ligase n=1 Tax=Mycobacterium pseudokansasii TaxID=2341080 RepID=A0A498QSU7_9MYCO|nr:RNA-splicing ligase RtcB [Mycobacterium pseudokansasii]VAZ92125.1 RNA-splicing ligase RtcB [Mycobacterium pseudokansasii]VBA48521.1 RNA-splicing ligase RtcB [Mycobacterium pseudokansasii]